MCVCACVCVREGGKEEGGREGKELGREGRNGQHQKRIIRKRESKTIRI